MRDSDRVTVWRRRGEEGEEEGGKEREDPSTSGWIAQQQLVDGGNVTEKYHSFLGV